MNDDRLHDFVERANRNMQNGQMPIVVEPRPSGWVCPKCGIEAEQRVEPVMLGGQPVPGAVKWLTLEDDVPTPVNVTAEEVTRRNPDGSPAQVYTTRHCLNCFNAWQRRKMMEELRANVPQLVRKPGA